MKLLHPKSEFKVIKTICSQKDKKIAAFAMASVSEDSFYHAPTLEAYQRIARLAKNTGELPTYSELCADPVLSEDTRKSLSKTEEQPLRTKMNAQKTLKILDKYRKLRGMYFMYEAGLKGLQQDKVDLDTMLEENTNVLTKLRSSADSESQVFTIGYKGSDFLYKDALYGPKIALVPTGFSAWDSVNGGLNETGVTVIGGTTGGGKCKPLAFRPTFQESIALQQVKLTLTDPESDKFTEIYLWPNQRVRLKDKTFVRVCHLSVEDDLDEEYLLTLKSANI